MSDVDVQADEFSILEAAAIEADAGAGFSEPVLDDLPVESEVATVPTEQVLEPLIAGTFNALAPNWNVSAEESRQLAVMYGGVIDKWFPDAGNKFGVELGAAVTTFAIFASRIGTPRKVEQKKESRAKKPEFQATPRRYAQEGEVMHYD